MVLRDRRRGSDGFGGSKCEFTWQVQGVGHFVKVVAPCFVVAKTLGIALYVAGAGRSHHGSYFEVEGFDS